MVTPDDRLKLIDWGLSTIRADTIPKALRRFPVVFNMPYSSILFNELFSSFYQDAFADNPKLLDEEPSQRTNLRLFIVSYVYALMKHSGEGHMQYVTIMMSRLYLPFIGSVTVQAERDTIAHNFALNQIVSYIEPVLRKFTRDGRFQEARYAKEVFSRNVDPWGAVMCYDALLARLGGAEPQPGELYRSTCGVFVDYLFRYSTEAIPMPPLERALLSLNHLPVPHLPREKERSPVSKTRRPKRTESAMKGRVRTRADRTRRRTHRRTHQARSSRASTRSSRERSRHSYTSSSELPSLYTSRQLDNLFSS